MSCLLTAPTVKEIAPFIDHLRSSTMNLSVEVLITGVGSISTVYKLVKQLSIRRPTLMIQAGIAGCFETKLTLGSVVAIKQDLVADLGVIENRQLRSIFDLGLESGNRLPFHKGWLKNPHSSLLKNCRLPLITGVTVNQLTTKKEMNRLIVEKYKAVCESMEGAAFHYVGLMEKIPFLQIRSISNYAGERNKKNWKLKEAITNLNQSLIHLLEKI